MFHGINEVTQKTVGFKLKKEKNSIQNMNERK